MLSQNEVLEDLLTTLNKNTNLDYNTLLNRRENDEEISNRYSRFSRK